MTNAQRQTRLAGATLALLQGTLIALAGSCAARADAPLDPAVAALVEPTKTVEVGVGDVSSGSYKANEYTGINKKGAYAIGNLDLRGGGAYGTGDAARWRVTGLKLGTDARSLTAEYELQSHFKIDVGYDELLRNRSDTYQTPLLGAGTDNLTLPSTWVVPLVPRVSAASPNARGLSPDVTSSSALVAGVLTAPTAAQLATATAIQAADLPLFHNFDLYTRRTKFNVGMTYDFAKSWQASGRYQHEDKTGQQPMGTISAATGGDISTTIPLRIDQTTEQINLDLRYHASKLRLDLGYYGSLFHNNVPSMSWFSWALPANSQTMSTMPSNQFHQAILDAGYAFTSATHLSLRGAYARSTQNESFLTALYTPLVPATSLHGLVVTKSLDMKLTSRPVKRLNLNAAYKFDFRDNLTAVNTYGFYDAGAAAGGTASPFSAYYPGVTLASNINLNANRPYSKKLNQVDLDADYQLAEGQNLRAGFEGQRIDRNCPGSWIDCADADTAKESTMRLDWRMHTSDTFSARIGIAHALRTVNYNEDAWLAVVPAAALSPAGAPGGSTAYDTLTALGLTGYGPVSGLDPLPTPGSAQAYFFANNNALANALYQNQNRISELVGMRRYNMADRIRNKAHATLDWQSTERLSLQLGYDYNGDDYTHSVYGLQKALSQAASLDATYIFNERFTLTGFFTHEQQTSRSAGNTYTANSTATSVAGFTAISGGCYATIALRNANNKVDPCLNWLSEMRDKVDTLGFTLTRKGLAHGKLDVAGSLAASRARTTNDVLGGNYQNDPLAVTGAAAGTVASFYIPATSLPAITTDTVDLKLSGTYALSANSSMRVAYRYQYMKSTDFMYDAMQYGGLTGVLPTSEQAPHYAVNSVGLSYIYSF